MEKYAHPIWHHLLFLGGTWYNVGLSLANEVGRQREKARQALGRVNWSSTTIGKSNWDPFGARTQTPHLHEGRFLAAHNPPNFFLSASGLPTCRFLNKITLK